MKLLISVLFALYHFVCCQGKESNKAEDMVERVFFGQQVSIKTIPYQAYVKPSYFNHSKSPYMFNLTCGGSLISTRHVLTAQHCMHGNGNEPLGVAVYLGSHLKDIGKQFGCPYTDYRRQKCWINHPDYDSKLIINDISLIILQFEVEYTNKILPIALPSWSDVNLDLNKKTAIISGWGYTEKSNKTSVPDLRVSTFEINQDCPEIPLQETQICTYRIPDGASTCLGDSGGPLAIEGKLFGITSYGNSKQRDCTPKTFTVFTNVAKYLDWIENNTNIEILP